MKSSTSTLLFVVAVTVAFSKNTMAQEREDQRELANLAEKWSIADPVVLYTGLDFTFDYDVSNYVDAGQAYYEVYDSECANVVATGITSSPLVDVAAGSETDPALFNIAGKTAQVPISIDANTIAANTAVYTETDIDGTIIATIVYCVRFGLNTLGDTPFEVNFDESVVTLTVDLSGGFSINDVDVTPKDQLLNTAVQSYTADGYMCQPGTDTPVIDANAAALQGSLITVCIKPNAEGIADGVKMRKIDSFQWGRGATTQTAVASGIAAGDLLTTFDEAACFGGDYCSFSSILFAAFYDTPGQVGGAGVASMHFGSTRRLAGNPGGLRSLQEQDDETTTSVVGLTLPIKAADDGPYQNAAGATTGTMLAAIAGLIGTVALL
jgi:hypothetical protein